MSKLNPVDFTAVTLEGRFWPERLETVLAKTIPSQFEEMVKHNINARIERAMAAGQ